MYNNDLPTRAELPSVKKLMQSTIIALIIAAIVTVTVVLPAEYGIDPTRIGHILGLTQMGEIKTTLAREAEQDRVSTAPTQATQETQTTQTTQSAPTAKSEQTSTTAKPTNRNDEMTVTLKPGESAEVKLEMSKDAKVKYEWTTSGGAVNHDTHADNPQIKYHGYGKGQQIERDAGELVAAFDGKHGWFWRSRGTSDVTVTLKTNGEYASIKRVG